MTKEETTEQPLVQLATERTFGPEQVYFYTVTVTLQTEDKKRKETRCNSVVLGCNSPLDILNMNFVSVSKAKIDTVCLDCNVNTAALAAVEKT